MTHFKYNLLLLIILLCVACRQHKPTLKEKILSNNQLSNCIDTPQKELDSIIWLTPKQFTPISFLSAVVKKNDKDAPINVITMTDEFPEDWVKESDIDTLMTLIQSTKKCNCILNPLSSYIPINNDADIGGYAIIFVNSFRQKTKIKLGLYNCPKTDKQSVKEINNWWTTYKQTKQHQLFTVYPVKVQ